MSPHKSGGRHNSLIANNNGNGTSNYKCCRPNLCWTMKDLQEKLLNKSNVTDTVRPFLSTTLFVIGTCYINQVVSLLLIFDIVFIFYKTLPVHCIYVLLCFEKIMSFDK